MKTKDDDVYSTGVAGGSSPAAAMVSGAKPVDRKGLEKTGKRSKRKAAKLRAVWISFTGRIVAQFVGSAASIVLGMILIHSYKAPAQGAEKATLVRDPLVYQGRVARELGVDLVLESSVTRSAHRIRVVAQLIDGRSDEHLWAGRYDLETGDILGLQSEIADEIARAIDATVSDSAPRPSAMASRATSAGNGAAFDARASAALLSESFARLQQH